MGSVRRVGTAWAGRSAPALFFPEEGQLSQQLRVFWLKQLVTMFSFLRRTSSLALVIFLYALLLVFAWVVVKNPI